MRNEMYSDNIDEDLAPIGNDVTVMLWYKL